MTDLESNVTFLSSICSLAPWAGQPRLPPAMGSSPQKPDRYYLHKRCSCRCPQIRALLRRKENGDHWHRVSRGAVTKWTPTVCLGLRLAQMEGEMAVISSTCFLQLQRTPQVSPLAVGEPEKVKEISMCFLPKCSWHIFLLVGGDRNLEQERLSTNSLVLAPGAHRWVSSLRRFFLHWSTWPAFMGLA